MDSPEQATNNSSNLSHLVVSLYLLTLALLPWTWFPPFPWLHEHAQWADAIFAVTVVAWAIERWRIGRRLRFKAAHAALTLYFLFAALSLLFASPDYRAGLPKLLGVAELCALTFITADLSSRPRVFPRIARTIAITSLVTAAAGIAGLLLFYTGIDSRLIGIYGELEPSPLYARIQAGTYNPNLLASFCIFASVMVARRDAEMPAWLRRVSLVGLWLTVLLTFSRGILGFVLAAAIRNARTHARKKIAGCVALICLALIISATIWKPTLDPIHPLEARLERVNSSRLQAATTSLVSLVAHPLLGTGLGTHPGLYQGQPFDAHLTPLNIAATLGLPALTTFSFLIFAIWRRRSRPIDLSVWGGLAGLALDGLAQDVEDFRHVWVMIGLAGAGLHTRNSSAPIAGTMSQTELQST